MKKILFTALAIVTIMLSVSSVYAWNEIPCEAGNCEGWSVKYSEYGDAYTFTFKNDSEEIAFDLICKINFYDYFGKLIGSISQKVKIPIKKQQVDFTSTRPKDTHRFGAEIYYKKEYQ